MPAVMAPLSQFRVTVTSKDGSCIHPSSTSNIPSLMRRIGASIHPCNPPTFNFGALLVTRLWVWGHSAPVPAQSILIPDIR